MIVWWVADLFNFQEGVATVVGIVVYVYLWGHAGEMGGCMGGV